MDTKHETMLHQLLYLGNLEAVQLLLEHGANFNMRNEKGQTPLHKTLIEMKDGFEDRYFDSIRFLLDHGADVDAPDNDKLTPLHVASQYGSVRATRLLLEHGASVHLQNHDGKTASEIASAEGHEEITRLLSEPVQSEEKSRKSSLMYV
jgi:ankyrin repeat protein